MTDPQTPTPDEHQQALFSHLVMMLTTSTMQYLGRMPDPSGQPGEVHLDAAQAMIDTLDMLSAKTQGNLTPDEAKMLLETLTSLKLTFVEQQQAGDAPAPTPAPPPEEEDVPASHAPAQEHPGVETTGAPTQEHKEPKFHKTYD